jgi:hypothetical protein
VEWAAWAEWTTKPSAYSLAKAINNSRVPKGARLFCVYATLGQSDEARRQNTLATLSVERYTTDLELADMSTFNPYARQYRILGTAALITAAGAFGLLFVVGFADWGLRLCVGLTTIALLASVILLVHRGRSNGRLLAFGLPLLFLLLPSVLVWIQMAPYVFGFPDAVGGNAFDVFQYVKAYRAGKGEARRDLEAGVLAIEEYGFGAGCCHRATLLRERHQIELRPIAQCLINARIVGHAAGYNSVSQPEIDRRVGQGAIRQAEEDGQRWDDEHRKRRKEAHQLFARKLSRLSAHETVVTESLWIHNDDPLDEKNLSEGDFARFIHALESLVARATPLQQTYAELHIHGAITPSARPTVEMSSGTADFPRSVYDEIARGVVTLPDVRSTTESVHYYVNFAAVAPPQIAQSDLAVRK